MSSSTLDPDNIPEPDRQLGLGHGTDALGPSDLSDTGSDVQGGYRAVEDADLGLDRGTNEDSDSHNIAPGSDTSDSGGTGEDSTSARNADVDLDTDITVDRVESLGLNDGDDLANAADVDGSADADPDLRAAAGTAADADVRDDVDRNVDLDLDDEADVELDATSADDIADADPDVDGDELLFDDLTRPPEPTVSKDRQTDA